MPVTIRPQPTKTGTNADPPVASSAELLQRTSKAWTVEPATARWAKTNKKVGPESRRVMRSSFTDLDVPGRMALVPYGNGFVDGVMRAFQQDLHLVLRPDDVWLAILVQFSFYVNGHAEELRSTFVAHEGKETLVVDVTPATIRNVDVGAFARAMVGLMDGYFVEEGVKDWLIPDFTTTTNDDRSVAAMILMATMQAYFEYVMICGCGFPSVRLEGEKNDWESMRDRVKRFARYGEEPAEWAVYLGKTLDYMIQSFDRPDDSDIKDFWMRSCHEAGFEGSGRGLASLSGWLTAFCFWDDEGKKINAFTDENLATYNFGDEVIDRKRLVLDGVAFPIIHRTSVPKAVADVPVEVVDLETNSKISATLIAGSVGMAATAVKNGFGMDTFQPRSGWWMLFDKSESLM